MKKVLLFISIFVLILTQQSYAYETVIIKYPPKQLWSKSYYKKVGDEAILQYLPKGQTRHNWKESIIVHAYYKSAYPTNVFITNSLIKMKRTNPTGNYKYIKLTPTDALATRCTNDFTHPNGRFVQGQCEFYRVTNVHDGIISIHYVNRDKEDFHATYNQWLEIIKKAKYYNSYYRGERTFDKAEYFELW